MSTDWKIKLRGKTSLWPRHCAKPVQLITIPQRKGGEKMKKFLGYAGFIVSILSELSALLGWIPKSIATVISGIFGFGSAGIFRAWIDEKTGSVKWFRKSYVIAAFGVCASLLYGFGVIPLESINVVLTAIAGMLGITIAQAVSKASK